MLLQYLGAGILVDLAFNEIEKVVETHKDEAGVILKSAFNEVQEAVKARGDRKEAAWDVLAILRQAGSNPGPCFRSKSR